MKKSSGQPAARETRGQANAPVRNAAESRFESKAAAGFKD